MCNRVLLIIILVTLAYGCNKTNNVDDRQPTFERINWVTFKYKNITGHVTRTPWTMDPIIVGDTLNALVSSRIAIDLNAKQQKRLIDILTKVNTESDSGQADCYYPRHGFVFWDSLQRPSAYVSICFECNRLEAKPELNKLDLYELEEFCREIGLPVFDNPLEHQKYFDSLENKMDNDSLRKSRSFSEIKKTG